MGFHQRYHTEFQQLVLVLHVRSVTLVGGVSWGEKGTMTSFKPLLLI